jgi:L-ascorbate metabolism protein UlaG (beta-lactamase superfamily)
MIRSFRSLLIIVLLLIPAAQAQLNNAPDTIKTDNGDLSVQPVLHGSMVFHWNGQIIFVDPYGGATRYADLGDPDLILISHPHDDHLNLDTLKGLNTRQATFIVPQAVADLMPAEYANQLRVLSNSENININGISITALPMYNLPEEGARHAKGWGNGYMLGVGGLNIYISGDTEDIPEMRGLTGIDVAFVCMNLPYTMDVTAAADAVLDFEPDIVYPYHHRGQDIEKFKALVDAGDKAIEVRLKDWYPEN